MKTFRERSPKINKYSVGENEEKTILVFPAATKKKNVAKVSQAAGGSVFFSFDWERVLPCYKSMRFCD